MKSRLSHQSLDELPSPQGSVVWYTHHVFPLVVSERRLEHDLGHDLQQVVGAVLCCEQELDLLRIKDTLHMADSVFRALCPPP